MPILYPCAVPGCANFATRGDGRCYVHRHSGLSSLVHSPGWRIRARLFRQRYPLCGDRPQAQAPVGSICFQMQPRRVRPAACVDHVRPHGGDRDLFWDETNNWQSLCLECHAAKTRREQ